MTGMWPGGVSEQHHGSHQQHMQQVPYNSGGYPGGPLDIYGAAAGGFDGWAVAQAAAQQYGVGGAQMVGHQHGMLPAHHHMAGHMGPHMMSQMGGHMPHAAANSNANRQNMMMHSWAPQHMHMPLMMHGPHGSNSSPPAGYMPQGGSSGNRGNWQPGNQKPGYGGGNFSNGRQPGGGGGGGGRGPMQGGGGRNGRPRRHIVLNTNPGESSQPPAAAWNTPATSDTTRGVEHPILGRGGQGEKWWAQH